FMVVDAREGWVDTWVQMIDLACTAGRHDLIIDVTDVRPYGAPLKTFGGQASGPAPLAASIIGIEQVLAGATGRRLCGMEAMQIDHEIAASVVAGGTRRCLPGYTRVNTARGSVQIADVVVGDEVITAKGRRRVSGFFRQGRQQLVLVKHAMGEIECTPNHRVAVYDSLGSWSFKEAQELTAGDHLVWDARGTEDGVNVTPAVDHKIAGRVGPAVGVDPNVRQRYPGVCSVAGCPADGTVTRNPALCNTHYLRMQKWGDPLLKTNHGVQGFETPELTPDFAWMIGLLHGDGHVSLRTGTDRPKLVSFAMSDDHPAISQRLQAILSGVGRVAVHQKPGERCHVVSVTNARFAEWCYANVKRANRAINIPEWVFASGSDVRWAYVAGLFDADGSCKTRPLMLTSTVYHSLASDLVRLMASLGVAAHAKPVIRPEEAWQPAWQVAVRGRENYLRTSENLLKHSCKFEAGERSSTGSGGNFGFTQEFVVAHGQSRYGGAKNRIVPVAELERRGIDLDGAFPTEFISVTPLPYLEETYDIEVEDIHQFTAEGLVVHNSARMSMMAWDDPQIWKFLRCKESHTQHWTTNISVEVNSAFHAALAVGDEHATKVLDAVAAGMAVNGEPGIVDSTAHSIGESAPMRMTNPCAEIALEFDPADAAGESCNIGSVDLASFGTDHFAASRAFRLMARFLLRATLNPYPGEAPGRIERRNRRIGVGIMGLQGWLATHGKKMTEFADDPGLRETMTGFRRAVRDSADSLADVLDIPRPRKVTAVAPTGSIAQLGGTGAGIHPVFARYFIRRVRYASTDPKLTGLAAKGYVIVDDVYAANTKVVEFPQQDTLAARYGDLIEQADEIAPADFLAMQNAIQVTLCGGTDGNAVSSTGALPTGMDPAVLVDAMKSVLGKGIKGITMFPEASGRQLAPYERITQDQFEQLSEKLFYAELSNLTGDSNSGECATGACPIR
ncbi:MAG: hypothetical protein M3Y35_13115, partial [Actinomycetota bacterium]|nr:hypothetical protein [Actinomycetota bacterium]